jgi:regulator of cell morphogenesis and NO signaling
MSTIAENILNVTLLEPRQKHPTIFARFDELSEGGSLTIHNDHDPKPLYYQLLGERGNIFKWEYLEQGPEWWDVKISKNISGSNDETLGEIAVKDLRKAEIFKKYGLDFCCGGKKTVKEACAEKGLDVTKIEQELQQADKVFETRALPYNEWNLDFLTDYIINTHHSYVRKQLPEILKYMDKVAEVHGSQHPELAKIKLLVHEVSDELTPHMVKEEKVLFPFIKKLVSADKEAIAAVEAQLGTVQNPINMMEMEHEMVGKNMEEIRTLSHNYALPADGCASYSLLYKMLEEFESDLHIHIHLENNILFPKALKIEKENSKIQAVFNQNN